MTAVPKPDETYIDLRNMALTRKPGEIGIENKPNGPQVWGVLMEFGNPNQVATIVALVDGSTSLYLGNGGGILGGGERTEVRKMTEIFLSVAEKKMLHFKPTTEFPYPDVDHVRFYLLTFLGPMMVEDVEQKIQNEKHLLYDLYAAGQDVFTELRIFSEGKEGDTRWEGVPGYVNCLLTALVEGNNRSIVLSSTKPVPPLLSVTSGDERLMDWLKRLKFNYAELDPKQVVEAIMESAGLSKMNIFKKQGIINTVLAPKTDDEKPQRYSIFIDKVRGDDGELALKILAKDK